MVKIPTGNKPIRIIWVHTTREDDIKGAVLKLGRVSKVVDRYQASILTNFGYCHL